jgi:heme-degrading monooxygenase HmoA
MIASPGQCLRLVPSRVQPGRLEDWLAAHRSQHTPEVRRQPGFVAKMLLQAEADSEQVAMVLLWASAEPAAAWVRHPRHDVVSARVSEFASPDPEGRAAAPRGGYRVLDAVTGAGTD